ncbi:probable Protein PET20, mitochondrial [Nakaseomyces glabratus]|nr:probable Protein PET20, mitochondrial [Nakaseomyces glabratus]SLM14027.1 probable Protein PET20, mitochondrial [Nakaseomyces glabratus]
MFVRLRSAGQVRYQSSFSFPSSQSLLQKGQLGKKKRSVRKLGLGISDKKQYNSGGWGRCEGSEVREGSDEEEVYDYSTLPRVEQISDTKLKNMSTEVLYSGYRPLFFDVEPKNSQEGKTLYEFAMKLEEFQEAMSPWVSSATGSEMYAEWDNVPGDVIKDLKPFTPPVVNSRKLNGATGENANDFDEQGNFQKKAFFDKVQSILNRNGKGGRKRPGVTVLKHLKKLKEQN